MTSPFTLHLCGPLLHLVVLSSEGFSIVPGNHDIWPTVRFALLDQCGFPDGLPGYHQFSVDVPVGKSVALSWSLVPAEGFGGGANGPLHLAVRKGSAIEFDFNGAVTADGIVDNAALANDAQAVTPTGNCLPAAGGRLFLTFLNTNDGGEGVATMGLALVNAPADGATVNSCD